MTVFESINHSTTKATDLGQDYIKKSQAYYKLKVFQQLTFTISMLGKALVIGSVLFIGFVFLAFALAMAIGNWLSNIALGYLIVSGLFFCIALIVYKLRHRIDQKIIKTMSPKFFNS